MSARSALTMEGRGLQKESPRQCACPIPTHSSGQNLEGPGGGLGGPAVSRGEGLLRANRRLYHIIGILV